MLCKLKATELEWQQLKKACWCTFALCWQPHAGSQSGTSAAVQGGSLLPWQHVRVPSGCQKPQHIPRKQSVQPPPS